MDPATVLGVVAAAVQFVDFPTKLVSRSYKICTSSSGELCDEERGVAIAQALRNLNGALKKSSETAIGTANATLDESDDENKDAARELLDLRTLCDGCSDVAQELLDALNKLTIDKTKRRAWESFRIALQSIWSGETIDRLERRLNAYRGQISMHMLWGLRKQVERGLQDLAHEQQQTREQILSLVSESHVWKQDVMAAIRAAPLPRVAPDSSTQTGFVKLLLRELHFQRISNREDKIPTAHQATFEWAFRPPRADQRPWADFGKWLGSDSSMYWITGKAGAGKSTLMKFIGNHKTTNEILRKLAGDRPLVVARFYFWNSGTELQMSQEGLLRTLTHEILAQRECLAIKAFPHRWELFRLFGIYDSGPTQYVELQRQLDQILKANASTQFVFFIDGLDEFVGDHADLAAYVKRLSDKENTKICISSRPWNVFEDAFASTPSLRVEDLTYPDVIRFIESSFDESPGYGELRMESPSEAQDLSHAVASKASGVFLWVSLVVRSLLVGLMNGEKLSKLRSRVDSLPLDLEQLFQRMLDQIHDDDREDSSRLFQIVRAAHQPPTVMALAWADENEPEFPLKRAIEPLSPEERDGSREVVLV
ncbi:hypothetical protein SLS58_010670 [Diplodia intermedia]|uniref:Nephrocystin 3-like N-terminal domain-containing protein n=1 Tax=Diplodia intermedia TaxID=856260 RepID=A0ABR3T4G6_9PEZI